MAAILDHRTLGRKICSMGASFCIPRLQSCSSLRQVDVSSPKEHKLSSLYLTRGLCCQAWSLLSEVVPYPTGAQQERLCAHHSHHTPNKQKSSLQNLALIWQKSCATRSRNLGSCTFQFVWIHALRKSKLPSTPADLPGNKASISNFKSSKWDRISDFPLLPRKSSNIYSAGILGSFPLTTVTFNLFHVLNLSHLSHTDVLKYNFFSFCKTTSFLTSGLKSFIWGKLNFHLMAKKKGKEKDLKKKKP